MADRNEKKEHTIEDKILKEFELNIADTMFFITNTLIPSESWKHHEVDIRTSRFIISCRDFIFIANRYFESKKELPACILKPLTLVAVKLFGPYPDQTFSSVGSPTEGLTLKLSEEQHKILNELTLDTIRRLDRLANFIRENVSYLIHQPLCEELCWAIICLKQARCMFRYTIIQDLGKDAQMIYEPKVSKKDSNNE